MEWVHAHNFYSKFSLKLDANLHQNFVSRKNLANLLAHLKPSNSPATLKIMEIAILLQFLMILMPSKYYL